MAGVIVDYSNLNSSSTAGEKSGSEGNSSDSSSDEKKCD